MKRTNVYVDGFNLYYGCLKGTPYKWLDLSKLCDTLLKGNAINRIRYFTARVRARPGDPNQQQRQQACIRALETIPNLSVHYGHFLVHPVRMPLANPQPSGPKTVEVMKTEEKGSDVNLATHLLYDGFRKDYEVAVVVSNDSDLLEPIRVVRRELGLTVGILNPQTRPSRVLAQEADFLKQIRSGALKASQFPAALKDAHGTVTKPKEW